MTFEEKLNEWFKKFEKMQPGEKIDIEKTGRRDPELFTDMCKFFIDQGHEDFELSNDKKYFKRINTFN